ncbi:MAG: hypothetical protein IGBAC_1415 [Ignavibacteriae bacterium]|nr:MAG: hypothetical protein IGBAC_1415 [Ignavibacteriota bacterium]
MFVFILKKSKTILIKLQLISNFSIFIEFYNKTFDNRKN